MGDSASESLELLFGSESLDNTSGIGIGDAAVDAGTLIAALVSSISLSSAAGPQVVPHNDLCATYTPRSS